MSKARTSKVTWLYEGREEVKQANNLLAIINNPNKDSGYFDRFEVALNALPEVNVLLRAHGATLLTKVIMSHSFYEAEKLIQYGADIKVAYADGRNIAHIAAAAGDVDILNFCIKNGIQVDSATISGAKIIQYAIANGNVKAVKFLHENGAVITSDDLFGTSDIYAGKTSKLPVFVLQKIIREVSGVVDPLIAASGEDLMRDPDGKQAAELDESEEAAIDEFFARFEGSSAPLSAPSSYDMSIEASIGMPVEEFRVQGPFPDDGDLGLTLPKRMVDEGAIPYADLDAIFYTSSYTGESIAVHATGSSACALPTSRSAASKSTSGRSTPFSEAFGFVSSDSDGELSAHSVSPLGQTDAAMNEAE